jgi:hypothetical protein
MSCPQCGAIRAHSCRCALDAASVKAQSIAQILGEELASKERSLRIVQLVRGLPRNLQFKLEASLHVMPTTVAARSLINLEASTRGSASPRL